MAMTDPARDSNKYKAGFALRVTWRALVLFIAINLLFALLDPLPALGRISAYNHIFPGRPRLPYGDNPARAYNLSLFNLEAMFASHELAGATKSEDEFRVILIGDSSTWGYLLPNEHTLATQINNLDARLPDGRTVRAYNLGYPVMSLTKDLLLLSCAMRYQPDLIIWPMTLESFPNDKQLFPPILQNNPGPVKQLINSYQLKLTPGESNWIEPGIGQRTLFGARRALADLWRLQLYGILWAATGIDQDIPLDYPLRQEDLSADLSFHNLQPGGLQADDLAFDVLEAGMRIADGVPVLLVNEPMFISQGQNSAIRYNFYYPRWAYDSFRDLLAAYSTAHGWNYLDLWDSIPSAEFTNTAVHLTPTGTERFAMLLLPYILNFGTESGAEI